MVCVSGVFSPVVYGQTKADVSGIQKDLEASSKRLSAHREAVTKEKTELAKKFMLSQAEIIEKRRKSRLAAMGNADRKVVLAKLVGEASAKGREVDYLEKQLAAFGGKVIASMYQGEVVDEERLPQGDSLAERMKALELGIARLEMMLGGAVVEAEVADATGKIQKGKIVSFGPVAWFASASGDAASSGAVVLDKASRNAKLIDAGNADVAKLVAGEEVSLEMDLTGGKARALASISNTPLALFSKGGAWIWPIIVVALVSLGCAIMKFLQLSKIKNPQGGWLSGLLEEVRAGNTDAAKGACDTVQHPIGAVMKNALSGVHKGADVVEEIVYEQMIDVQTRLQKWLPFIAVTAAIAPLLGLLGTVSGMITTFNGLSVVGTGDPKLLSGGISEALVTTLFGLVVAIPALILHSLLSRRSQGIIQTTEKIGLTVVNCIRKK